MVSQVNSTVTAGSKRYQICYLRRSLPHTVILFIFPARFSSGWSIKTADLGQRQGPHYPAKLSGSDPSMRENGLSFQLFSGVARKKTSAFFWTMSGGICIALSLFNFLLQDMRWYWVLEPTHSLPSARNLNDGWAALNLNNEKGRVRLSPVRRCGRVAEGAPLLREYRVCSPIEGSNPSVSAS